MTTHETVESVDVASPVDRSRENRLAAVNLAVSLVALFIGVTTGLFQALDHAGVNVYPKLAPAVQSYYHGLSMHGVLNALVFTAFFNVAFLQFLAPRAYGIPLASVKLGWITFAIMFTGLVMAAVPLLGNMATVMFTFYPPMKANAFFYLGLTLVVAGTWLVTANLAMTHRQWRRTHPGVATPSVGYMSMATFAMWTIASMGIAIEMIALVLPWSFGLVQGTDPLIARTLFWFTGHPIVYFWLLPAYISWYTLVPAQAGGRLFSEPMARVTFLLFLLLSTPVGLHHQYTDPGISQGWKFLHGFLTFGVFFPSLLTYFNVIASLENAGRARGGKGWFRWFLHLPWGNPSVAAQLAAMVGFAFGGISGLINASLSLNLIVHNTSWVPGHLHLTIGTAVTMTFIGITYWLVPYLAGRPLFSRHMALAQVGLWVVGMYFFSHSMHSLGIEGMPRRTAIAQAPYVQQAWSGDLKLIGLGGTVLFVSALLYFLNIILTAVVRKKEVAAPEVPAFATSVLPISPRISAIFDKWWIWISFATALILLAYAPTLIHLWSTSPMDVPGVRVW